MVHIFLSVHTCNSKTCKKTVSYETTHCPQVPEGVELKFTYCVRLNDGQIVATDTVVQLAQNPSREASREVYYVMPKLGQWDTTSCLN